MEKQIMSKNEHIYIVLIKALTGLGKFSRYVNKYEYTHIAVSLNEELREFATFSRRKHYSPFNAGFMYEKRAHYVFGNNEKVKIKVFRLPVNKEEITEYIDRIEQDKEYVFNLYSMITMPFLHGIKIYKAHNCMSFVSRIIELSNSVQMNKKSHKYNIQELDDLLKDFFYKECYLEKEDEDKEYMCKGGAFTNISSFFKLNAALIYRILFRRNESYE